MAQGINWDLGSGDFTCKLSNLVRLTCNFTQLNILTDLRPTDQSKTLLQLDVWATLGKSFILIVMWLLHLEDEGMGYLLSLNLMLEVQNSKSELRQSWYSQQGKVIFSKLFALKINLR